MISYDDALFAATNPAEFALRAQGVPTHLQVAPATGHIWARPRHQLSKMNAELEWFEKYVRNLQYKPEDFPATNDPKVIPAP